MPRSARKSLTTQSSAHSAGMILAKMCQNSGQQNNNNINANTNTNKSIINNNNSINSNTNNSKTSIMNINTNSGSTGGQLSGPSIASSTQSQSSLSGTPSILHSKKHSSTSLTPHSQSLINIMDDNNSSSNFSTIMSSSSPSSMSRSNAFASLIGAATNQFNQFNIDSLQSVPVKRRKQDPKTGKGLRHFSMKV